MLFLRIGVTMFVAADTFAVFFDRPSFMQQGFSYDLCCPAIRRRAGNEDKKSSPPGKDFG